MIHHGRISDSEMKGSGVAVAAGTGGSNARRRHSLDWHLIESGRGAFDCISCQYHTIVFLTEMAALTFFFFFFFAIELLFHLSVQYLIDI